MGKRWLITLSLLLLAQCVFILIDGTILEPQLNSIGNFMTDIVGPKLEWFTLYDSTFMKCVTLLFALYIIVAAMNDIVALLRRR